MYQFHEAEKNITYLFEVIRDWENKDNQKNGEIQQLKNELQQFKSENESLKETIHKLQKKCNDLKESDTSFRFLLKQETQETIKYKKECDDLKESDASIRFLLQQQSQATIKYKKIDDKLKQLLFECKEEKIVIDDKKMKMENENYIKIKSGDGGMACTLIDYLSLVLHFC